MERKKIVWIQIMQAWTMLLVVIGHSCILGVGNGPDWETAIYSFAQPFRMPLFILISGLLFSMTRALPLTNEGGYKWQYIPMLKDKAIRLLIPFVFTTFVAFALKIAFPGEMSRQASLSFHEIVHAFLYPNDNPMRELWFIATIFWMFIMMPIWRFTFKKNYIIVITILVLYLFYKYHPDVEFLCIGSFFKRAIWFYLGMVIFKCDIINKYCSPHKLITFLGGGTFVFNRLLYRLVLYDFRRDVFFNCTRSYL